VSGYTGYVGDFKDGLWHGQLGRFYFSDGRIYTGTWENDLMKDGTLNELKGDDTRELYQVQYDAESDFEMGHGCDEQEPIVKKKI
jgi:hypothetical protein